MTFGVPARTGRDHCERGWNLSEIGSLEIKLKCLDLTLNISPPLL